MLDGAIDYVVVIIAVEVVQIVEVGDVWWLEMTRERLVLFWPGANGG